MKIDTWPLFLYINAVLLIAIPIMIVLLFNVSFSAIVSHFIISFAILCVIVGKGVTVNLKRQKNINYVTDVGVIIGLFLVFIITLL